MIEKGDFEAMFRLGKFLLLPESSTTDELAGLGWMIRGAECGHPRAIALVGIMCLEGKVVRKNIKHANQLLQAGAKKGCVQAHYTLGVAYSNERKAVSSHGIATQGKFLDHWKFAAVGGCRNSMRELESLEGRDLVITEEDFDLIKEKFENAAAQEWSKEREEWRKDGLQGNIKQMILKRRQGSQSM